MKPFPPPNLQDYKTVPPTAQTYADSCNEFWWVSTYVAKGLWRHELPYAKFMLDRPVRDALHLMLEWHMGIQSDFTADPGSRENTWRSTLSLIIGRPTSKRLRMQTMNICGSLFLSWVIYSEKLPRKWRTIMVINTRFRTINVLLTISIT
ncbi:Aminoglycoside 6-adenylyltransferase [compost metagenome]